MTGKNALTIIGNVVRDAKLEKININGVPTSCCRFSVAVNELRANKEPIVTYFEVTAWREYAERVAPWLQKGRQVCVDGKIRLHTYEDSNHVMHASMQIHSPEITLLGKKPEAERSEPEPVVIDELPF